MTTFLVGIGVAALLVAAMGVGLILWLRSAHPDAIKSFWLGPRPEINLEDYRVMRDLSRISTRGVEAEEHQQDRWRVEAEMIESWFTRPWILRSGVVLLGLAETLGSVLVLKSVGYEPPERILLGICLATVLFAMAIVIGRLRSSGAKLGFRIGLALFGLVILCIGIVRMNEVGGAEESLALMLAATIIGVVLSIGPAWCAELLIAKLRQSVPVMRKFKACGEPEKNADGQRNAAEKAMLRRHAAVERYDRRKERLRGFFKAIGNKYS